jgi:dienelactone hydrolase
MKRLNYFTLVMLFSSAIFVLVPALGYAQVARVEIHPYQSITLTDQEFLSGRKEGKPVTIAGELRIPKSGNDRLPAVVLLHGSGGNGGYTDDWAQSLNAMGIATFVPDSFTGRGITTVANDQSQLGRLATIIDAYRALELLRKHPRIDPERIAVMGFSRGGQAALYSSMKRFWRMHGSATSPEFAAYIAFYPDCMTTYLKDDDVVDRPIRVFHGGADDWNPVAPCKSYVERLRKAGKDIHLIEYADAQHFFDWAMLKTPQKLAQAQTMRSCRLEEAVDGQINNGQTKQPFNYSDPCVERGVTIVYNAQAANEAQKAVKDFIMSVFKLK